MPRDGPTKKINNNKSSKEQKISLPQIKSPKIQPQRLSILTIIILI